MPSLTMFQVSAVNGLRVEIEMEQKRDEAVQSGTKFLDIPSFQAVEPGSGEGPGLANTFCIRAWQSNLAVLYFCVLRSKQVTL
jgi:hypothetical protein